MNFFWIYEMPVWLSFFVVTGAFTAFSLGGMYLARNFVSKSWEGHDNNDQIGFYLSAIGVFYGITLGLLAAGVWQSYQETESKVGAEAVAIGALYRDLSSFPKPINAVMKQQLENYTSYVIYRAWPLHKQGVIATGEGELLSSLQYTLYGFDPTDNKEMALLQETLTQYNKLLEVRRQRLQCVNTGTPSIVWVVIILGALITLSICWLFNTSSWRLHIIMNVLIGLTVGSLIYLIMMLDYPFRGDVAIGTEAYEEVYTLLMKKNLH